MEVHFVATRFVEDVPRGIEYEYELPNNRMDMEAYMASTLLTDICQTVDSTGRWRDLLKLMLRDERIRVSWNIGEGNILVDMPNTTLGHVPGAPVLMIFRTGQKIFSYIVSMGETRCLVVYWAVDGDISPFFSIVYTFHLSRVIQ